MVIQSAMFFHRIILGALAVLLCSSAPIAQEKIPNSRTEITLSFAPLVREAAPAVVNIYAKVIRPGRQSVFQRDPFFSDFFGEFWRSQPRLQSSLGSGVILSSDGIVVSNYHVVGQATDIRVILSDRREFSAQILLGDEANDLVVLQLNGASDLPALDLRDSDQVQVGELVLAIGNPFGVGQTVSSGIVSGLARTGAAFGKAHGYYLQTDAPINPGNSGGALVDMDGRLLGINTSILSKSGGSNGIGFAIPANLVAEFVDQAMLGTSEFRQPWAGLGVQAVDSDLAESFGMGLPQGVLISTVHPASPFADAGLMVGDIITEVELLEVNSLSEMQFRMSVVGIGSNVQITYLRKGQVQETSVVMIAAPDIPPRATEVLGSDTALPGLTIERVNPATISEFGLPLSATGIVVTEVGRFGGRVGLRSGDVIFRINGKEVRQPEEIRRVLSRRNRSIQVELMRRSQKVTLRFRI